MELPTQAIAQPRLTVSIRNKSYDDRSILKEVDFSVDGNEFVSLLGPSGGGKTTILRMISCLDTDFDGTISVDGVPVDSPSPDRGLVFQESRLLPWLDVEKNVEFGLPSGLSNSERRERVGHVLEIVKLDEASKLLPYQLSGGMEKRVSLARALVNLPSVLLLDEPFSAVDPFIRRGLHDQVALIHSRDQLATLLVTHDVDEAVYLSDRILILTGSPATVGHEIKIDTARPRRRTDEDTIRLKQHVLDLLLTN